MADVTDSFTLFDGSEMSVLERPAGPGDPLVMEFVLKDGCGAPPPHTHPSTEEIFEVTDGEFEMLVDREWRAVRAGESVTVPAGLRHTFRNQSGSTVVIRNTHAPHHDFETYIRALAALSHEIEATSPNGPGAVVRMSMLWKRHDDLIRPSDPPMKLAMSLAAGIGRVARIKV